MKTKINFRALAFLLAMFFAACLFIACAGKKPWWGDETNGYILKYNLPVNQSWSYHASTLQITSQEVMGQTMEFTNDIVSNYTITGLGLDEQKNIKTMVKMDSISITMKSMRGDKSYDLSPIIGKSFTMIFSPTGKKIKFIDPDSITVDFGRGGKRNAESFFKKLLPRLPQHPVKMGDTWTITDKDTIVQNGLNIEVETETKSTLQGKEEINGLKCFKISSKSISMMNGSGKNRGMDIYFEGDGEGASTWYFAYGKGTFIKATSDYLMEGTVSVTGPQNMTIPMSQEINSEVSLVK